MPSRFPYKLSQYEVQPPAASWEKLSHWLRTEHRESDAVVQEKLAGSEIIPPPRSWEKISAALSDKVPVAREKPRSGIAIPGYKRLVAAAAITAIVSIAAFYFFNPAQRKEPAPLAVIDRPLAPLHPAPTPQAPSAPAPYAAASGPGKNGLRAPQAAKTATGSIASNHVSSESYPDTDDRLIAENFIASADIPEIRAVDALQPVAVKAPPIRDESGQIIMDLNLVRSPNSPHIVVTSPNGSQTRISNKFLHCLSYLNA